MIQDSGTRRSFNSGAVRDAESGKGRCDLLPLDVVAELEGSEVLKSIDLYIQHRNTAYLYAALGNYLAEEECIYRNTEDMFLELAKHFEEGCNKYGERNWEKGIPENVYIDSAVRHYLKWRRGDEDEPHDRAFVWNIICLIWTHKHITEEVDA